MSDIPETPQWPTTSAKLYRLAEFLMTVPDAKFNMGRWRSSHCGTVGCAIGWMHAAFGLADDVFVQGDDSMGSTRMMPHSNTALALEFLGMDHWRKRRPHERYGWSDFDRLFVDSDHRLHQGGYLHDVRKAAVIKRIRACAKHYASMGR